VIEISLHCIGHQSGDLRSVHDRGKLGLRIVDHDLGASVLTCGRFSIDGAANVISPRVEVAEFGRAGNNEVEADGRFRIIDNAGIRIRRGEGG
jgi:hypothetical protein